MSYYGIRNGTLNWITEFLRGRQQQVVVDGETSEPAEVTSGVPQGTVLGPTLFLIYINDIADNINSTIRLFADDSVVYRQINSPDDHRILQEDLQKLVEWSKTWQTEFNVDKCAIMNFGILRNISKFDYKMKKQSLQVVKHHPYLGVELSDNMKYNLHIDSITSKASRVHGFVKRNLRHYPKVVKERAYQSLVRRVLTNSKVGLFYSNFLILTPTFSKVPIEKYGKTPIFSGKQHFYSYFQNPSENSGASKAWIQFNNLEPSTSHSEEANWTSTEKCCSFCIKQTI